MSQEVVLTGLRTNAAYHLGNYIGALLPLLQKINSGDYKIHLFAPDLHSFTTPIDFTKLYSQTITNLKFFVAAGIPLDNPNIYLYRQSQIPAHSELTWILSNFTSFGDLNRMVEFKDKASRLSEQQVGVGLFLYPVLMAADILLYDANWVPVGDDQRQHLEFCRRLAKTFNNKFAQTVFTIPHDFKKQQEWLQRSEAPRIRNLKHPDRKMSKSAGDISGTIMLTDSLATVTSKIMAATTDNFASINYDWQKQPGITNLLTILASLSNQPQTEINQAWQGQTNYKALKEAVIEQVTASLSSLQTNWQTVDEIALNNHLQASEETLNQIANQKLAIIQKLIGLKQS